MTENEYLPMDCDLCNKDINLENGSWDELDIKKLEEDGQFKTNDHYDICEGCMKKIEEFLKTLGKKQ